MVTALSQNDDLYQNFRFAVYSVGNYIQSDAFEAGFNSCSLPDHNIDAIEYSEGTFTYSRWMPGRSSFSTVTLTKGVARNYTKFADWIKSCAEGRDYRTDIVIMHLHRADVDGAPKMNLIGNPRKILLKNCLPVRFKPGSDFDSFGADMSIEEIEFHPESFSLELGSVPQERSLFGIRF